jgi:hypothetical protein
MDIALPIGVIIGLINGIKLIEAQDKKPFIYFCISLIAGTVLGYMGKYGLTLETGLMVGLASSGFYKVGQVIGR